MTADETQLRERLRKIEALFAGAGTAGERDAAEAALNRVRERLAEMGRRDSAIEMQFSMADQWSRRLFLALSRRYGLQPYRYGRQRLTTVMVRVPRGLKEAAKPTKAIRPKGMLMKKIQCQLAFSDSQPPANGPRTDEVENTAAKTP